MTIPGLTLEGCAFELEQRRDEFPRIYISITGFIGMLSEDIDVVEMAAFKEKVRAFVEGELPKHVKVKEAQP